MGTAIRNALQLVDPAARSATDDPGQAALSSLMSAREGVLALAARAEGKVNSTAGVWFSKMVDSYTQGPHLKT
eukprot:10116799-Alexandrium_andersonii.AAC.1